jgi:hypothetical protein
MCVGVDDSRLNFIERITNLLDSYSPMAAAIVSGVL